MNDDIEEYLTMDSRLYTASDKFLGSAHLSGDVHLMIDSVSIEEMRDGSEKMCVGWNASDTNTDGKPFLPFLLNKTNIKRLQKMFGDDTESWLGQQVTIYNDPDVEFMGEVVGGLRVRVVEKKA